MSSPPTRRCWPCTAPSWRARREAAALSLAFEAAVAGGIPIIKTLREGLAGNRVARVYGILNGTCNYILTTMRETGRDFADVLAEAQQLGYAEADPSFDVDGIDAAHKLAILAGVAFGARSTSPASMSRASATSRSIDIEFAEELGYRIKLLGIARDDRARASSSACIPAWCRSRRRSPQVEGVFNAVVDRGRFRRPDRVPGPRRRRRADRLGRRRRPRRHRRAAATCRPSSCRPRACRPDAVAPMDRQSGAYYIRLMVLDQPGVIADVAAALARRARLAGIDDPARPRSPAKRCRWC